jgi:uncharacterized alkaline shock family protein YloU
VTGDPASPEASAAVAPLSVIEAEVEAVAAAVRSCAAVVDLAGGDFGEVATYLPGRRITGVRVTDDRIDVHLVGRYGVPIPALAAEVRTALTHLARGRAVDIRVEDLGREPPTPA